MQTHKSQGLFGKGLKAKMAAKNNQVIHSPFTNEKDSPSTKIEAFAENKMNFVKMMISVFYRVNIT